MLKYKNFLLEQEEKEENWKLTIDISKIWNQYDKNIIGLDRFNSAYIEFLTHNKDIIQEKTNNWEKLNDIIIRLNEKKSDIENSYAVWDDIYDWGDSNLVEIKVQNKIDF